MKHIIQHLIRSGAEVYQVGGCVRDLLLGKPVKDIDFVVRKLPMERLKALLRPFGDVSLVGKTFGVLKFRPSGEDAIYDIALPRKEVSTGAGHREFQVTFDAELPLIVDLGRRDFTMNAIAQALNEDGSVGELIDPFHGARDLKEGLLRQVFREAFVEDPLRLLRAVQFSARFNLTPDDDTLLSMREHAPSIVHISPERVIEEIRKLFLADQPSIGFRLMRDVGLLPFLFPPVENMIGVMQPKKDEDVFDHTMKVLDASRATPEMDYAGELNVMFAALFHDSGKPRTVGFDEVKQQVTFYGHQIVSKHIVRKWMKKYRIETIGVAPDVVVNLVENHMFETKSFFSDRALRRFIRKVGPDCIVRLLDLRIADKKGGKYPNKLREIMKLKERVIVELTKKTPLGPKDLVVNGHDLMALGIKAGPEMGRVIHLMVDLVVDDPSKNTREALLHFIESGAYLTYEREPDEDSVPDEMVAPFSDDDLVPQH